MTIFFNVERTDPSTGETRNVRVKGGELSWEEQRDLGLPEPRQDNAAPQDIRVVKLRGF